MLFTVVIIASTLRLLQCYIVNISFPAMRNLAYSGYVNITRAVMTILKKTESHGEQHG